MIDYLVHFGVVLFVSMGIGSFILNFFPAKWYWEKFIPKLHEKENTHPIITGIIILLLVIIMLIGVMCSI